jgi:hypothetical protein
MSPRALALLVACSLALCSAVAPLGAGPSDEHACCRESAETGAVAPGGAADASGVDCCEAPSIPAGAERSLDAARTVALPVGAVALLEPCSNVLGVHEGRAAGVSPPPDRTTVLRI